MTRLQKEKVVSSLKFDFEESSAVLVCDYKGLNTKSIEALRKNARQVNVKVQIIKNTLASLALKAANKDGLKLKDTNIFLWGEDSLSVTKVGAKFEEENEKFSLKAAYLDDEVASLDKVRTLAKMPSRDELLAMLLQVWKAPIANFTIGLNALKEKKEQE